MNLLMIAMAMAIWTASTPQKAMMLRPLAKVASDAHGVPVHVTMAIMEQESNYSPTTVSKTHDCGAMGVHVARSNRGKCLALRFAPYGVWKGVSALAYWRKKAPDMRTALACYNAGNSCDSFGYADVVLARAARIRRTL